MLSETHKLFLELFLNEYPFWLTKNSSVKKLDNGWFELTTSYLDKHNDYIVVYAIKPFGIITIHDGGETIGGLSLIIHRDVKKVLTTYGIQQDETGLYVDCNEGDFAQKLHNLISAIIEINALSYATTN
jgi:hypothetical protein